MIRPLQASFITSAPKISLAPSFGLSEVAFLGRSNVGKSSLINALVNQKGLAKSSSTPGKTQLINFFKASFEVEDLDKFLNSSSSLAELSKSEQDIKDEPQKQRIELMFVDLPGFGYAKVSKAQHKQWQKHLDDFLRNRSDIRLFIQLVDSRHFDLDIDINLNQYLNEFLRPDQQILRVYTKSDKLNQKALSALKKFDPKALVVSANNAKSISMLRARILQAVLGV